MDEKLGLFNEVHIVARHADGTVFLDETKKNQVQTQGWSWLASLIGEAVGKPVKWIGLSSNDLPAAAATGFSTDLYTDSGLDANDASATYSYSAGPPHVITLGGATTKFTSTANSKTVKCAGLFLDDTGIDTDKMMFAVQFTTVTLNNTDELTITWSITLS